MAKKPPAYVYGQSKAPASWQETATILKQQKPKKKREKSSGLLDKLDQLLKERKG